MRWTCVVKTTKISTVASKLDVNLCLRSTLAQGVRREIRMSNIVEVISTLVNGDQDQWLGMKGNISMNKNGFGLISCMENKTMQ